MQTNVANRIATFLDSWLTYRFHQSGLPGLSVAVTQRGEKVFSGQYGHAALETTNPLRGDHLFGVASQSKMFTAVAALQLHEQGTLSLDVPIGRYLPWFKVHAQAWAKDITARQLLTHSAGLARDFPNADFWLLEQPFPQQTSLRKMLLATPLLVEPNTQLKYSNAGYALLGQIIETVSGQSFGDYIQEHIIQKIDLQDTFVDYGASLADRTVTGYGIPLYGKRMPLPPRRPTHTLAAVTGVHATAADMCRFATALCTDNDTRLLSRASKRELLRTHWVQADGYDAGQAFAMGFEVLSIGGKQIVGHGGHMAGHLSATFFDPSSSYAVAVLANSKDSPSPQIAISIFEALHFFSEHAETSTPKALARFTARLFSPIATIEIIATAGKIIAIEPDDWQSFAFQEELEQVDEKTLRIITPGSIFNEGEQVHYNFKDNRVRSVTYAGGTLLPEDAYKAKYFGT